MKKLSTQYKEAFTPARFRSLGVALLLLAIAMIVQHYSIAYTARNETRFVGDLFLDNIPVINLNFIIVEGALWAILLSAVCLVLQPRYIIFTLKTVALFIVVRSFFVSVTHLGIYPGQIVPSAGFMDQIYLWFNLQTGSFFSAHTGLPFLMSLIFWNEKHVRYAFFIASFVFGISVLLAHVHYSIDVFAAPFISYGIFKISEHLFKEDIPEG